MEQILKYLLCAVVCLSFLNAFTIAASLPYDIDLDNFSPEEIEQAMQMVDDVPVKRGMCRSGFIYQAITRDCIPSLGVLRGRGRHGRRGRRGLTAWSWRRA
ncbi:uncharacterized protein LOC132743026 [Ruditapes philippinarum]|uniref:uncharacterized protein LOC132743026 n=1 Tax=Ruditapes philippinarum TaxID=129788 RepID=UPI00295BFDF0|nr:uncharacterized protein LOC132743026 [Ruditapes philippinarum]